MGMIIMKSLLYNETYYFVHNSYVHTSFLGKDKSSDDDLKIDDLNSLNELQKLSLIFNQYTHFFRF